MLRKNDNADLKAFAVLGVIGLIAMIFGPVVWLTWSYMKNLPAARVSTSSTTTASGPVGPLGELNSTCGGPDRLPCRPGLKCSNGTDYGKTGICIKDYTPATTNVVAPSGPITKQLGEACVQPDYCASGLVCAAGKQGNATTTGICQKIDASSPNILKLKLDGAAPLQGKYSAAAGSTIKLDIQTINADRVEAYFVPSDAPAKRQPIALKQGVGGTYQSAADFKVMSKMTGDFTVWVFKGASFAVLSLPFASQE